MRLQSQVLLQIIGIALVLTISYLIMEQKNERSRLTAEENRFQHVLLTTAMSPLAKAIWEINHEGALATIRPFFELPNVLSFMVYDDHGTFQLGYRRTQDKVTEIPKDQGTDFTTLVPPGTNPKEPISKTSSPSGIAELQMSLNEKQSRTVIPITQPDENGNQNFLGHAIVDYSNDHLEAQLQEAITRFLTWTIGFVAINAFLTFLFLRRSVVNPVQTISTASQRVASGNFETVPALQGKDEIAILGDSFNRMVRSMQRNLEDLQLLREEGAKIVNTRDLAILSSTVQQSINLLCKTNRFRSLYLNTSYVDSDKLLPGYLLLETGEMSSPTVLENPPETPPMERAVEIRTADQTTLAAVIYVDNHDLGPEQWLIIQALSGYVSSTLDNIKFLYEQKKQERLGKEFEAARLVQETLIPPPTLVTGCNFDIFSHVSTASECGGDWWGYYPLSKDRLLLLIGDVTGHGISSALLTGVVRGYAETLAKRDFQSPAAILKELSEIVSRIGRTERLMTMFAIILDFRTMELTYANAGHNFPFIRSAKSSTEWKRLIAQGPRLGYEAFGEASLLHQEKRIPFQIGDCLFLFTDGLPEGRNLEGEQMGEFRLKDILSTASHLDPQAIIENVIASAKEFYQGHPLDDDMTLAAIRITGGSSAIAEKPLN